MGWEVLGVSYSDKDNALMYMGAFPHMLQLVKRG